MTFTEITIMGIAFLCSAILSLIGIPVLKKMKIGQMVRSEGPRSHLKKQGTPTMGGIFILLTTLIVLGFYSMKYTVLIIPTICTILFGIVGFEDDYKKLVNKNTDGISAKKKMLGLFIVASIFVAAEIYFNHAAMDITIPLWNQPIALPLVAFIPFTIFVLLATTNAVNLTDGLDGLAGGVSLIILAFLTVSAISLGNTAIAIFGSTIIGAILGFLVFNLKPAKVFMGDTGSLALGGAIAIMAILLKMPLYLIIVAIIPILEVVSVIIQVIVFKITKGKVRVFKMAPIHHHFELSGWGETAVVIFFWIVTILACAFAYMI